MCNSISEICQHSQSGNPSHNTPRPPQCHRRHASSSHTSFRMRTQFVPVLLLSFDGKSAHGLAFVSLHLTCPARFFRRGIIRGGIIIAARDAPRLCHIWPYAARAE